MAAAKMFPLVVIWLLIFRILLAVGSGYDRRPFWLIEELKERKNDEGKERKNGEKDRIEGK